MHHKISALFLTLVALFACPSAYVTPPTGIVSLETEAVETGPLGYTADPVVSSGFSKLDPTDAALRNVSVHRQTLHELRNVFLSFSSAEAEGETVQRPSARHVVLRAAPKQGPPALIS